MNFEDIKQFAMENKKGLTVGVIIGLLLSRILR